MGNLIAGKNNNNTLTLCVCVFHTSCSLILFAVKQANFLSYLQVGLPPMSGAVMWLSHMYLGH